jgi:hypothetical protein
MYQLQVRAHLRRYVLHISAATAILIRCQKDYAASVLAVLKRFGYDIENLNGPKVHSLYNVMTMEKNVHDWFDRLEMWFEATVRAICMKSAYFD